MDGPLKIVFNFSRFKPALNRFLADLSRGSNLLNSDTDVGKDRKNVQKEILSKITDRGKDGTSNSKILICWCLYINILL